MQLQGSSVDAPLDGALPLQQHKVVLVVDLVESVRLMAGNEAAVVERWQGFMRFAAKCVPEHRGRLVKSLGDGLLAEFDEAADAVQTAMALHSHFIPVNNALHPNEQLHLRAGINASQLYVGEHDVYGHGVNLAARVASLAGPDQIVVTSPVRDALVDGMDGDVEDMGESYLKHWPEPVRTWRVWPVDRVGDGAARSKAALPVQEDLRPSIAVIPFDCHPPSPEHQVVGELIADGVITQLSREGQLRVISRLSTTALRGRQVTLTNIHQLLAASFVLSGSYSVMGGKVVINAELSDARRNDVVWADRVIGTVDDLLQMESQLIHQLTDASTQALMSCTIRRAMVLPVPHLDSNALLLGGIAMMHRSTARDLDRSRELLDAVTSRHARVATPWAWMAKWHILNVIQGRSDDAPTEFRRAIDISDRALDLEPHSSLALAIKGHLLCHLGVDLDQSRELLLMATEVNPNDHNAWLYAGFWSTMWGDPTDAVRESERALKLSPLDPQRFFIEMLVAHSYLVANDLPQAINMCHQSLRRNRYYLATLRVLMTAQYEVGQVEHARQTLGQLLALQPDLSVSKFLSYGGQSKIRQRAADAMAGLGLPR
jgi:class 3 adenylate cyclase/TolB-like protein/Tfp pilus assembly protein PilF